MGSSVEFVLSVTSKYDHTVEVVASALIVNARSEALLIKSPRWGEQWLLPGGHVDYGERILDAAAREAKEETGLEVEPKYCVNVGELIFDPSYHRKAHLIFFHVLCEAKHEQVKLDGRELTEYRWVKPEDVVREKLEVRTMRTIKNYLTGVRIEIPSKQQ